MASSPVSGKHSAALGQFRWPRSICGVTPRAMRRFAIVVGFIGSFTAALGIANLISGFIGSQIWTVVALVGTACAVGLTAELWYVSRRIEHGPTLDQNANPS